ncbi:hypothetical protein HK103_005084 [Boothiomyces macroporosus]|uniref:Uncharacterized protein n=1 Tax=Boothiomyces macroporosus TaxID=261099 RepID=A0AAD5UG57_9FUNG|nr:hypothetical protein HK103_005084 [Boothiomyces macroporosus]
MITSVNCLANPENAIEQALSQLKNNTTVKIKAQKLIRQLEELIVWKEILDDTSEDSESSDDDLLELYCAIVESSAVYSKTVLPKQTACRNRVMNLAGKKLKQPPSMKKSSFVKPTNRPEPKQLFCNVGNLGQTEDQTDSRIYLESDLQKTSTIPRNSQTLTVESHLSSISPLNSQFSITSNYCTPPHKSKNTMDLQILTFTPPSIGPSSAFRKKVSIPRSQLTSPLNKRKPNLFESLGNKKGKFDILEVLFAMKRESFQMNYEMKWRDIELREKELQLKQARLKEETRSVIISTLIKQERPFMEIIEHWNSTTGI